MTGVFSDTGAISGAAAKFQNAWCERHTADWGCDEPNPDHKSKSLARRSLVGAGESATVRNHPNIADLLQNISALQVALGRHTEAIEALSEAATIYEAVILPGNPVTAYPHISLAGLYSELDRPAELEHHARRIRCPEANLPGPTVSENSGVLRPLSYTSTELNSEMAGLCPWKYGVRCGSMTACLTVAIGVLSVAELRGDLQPPEIIIDEENSARTVQVDVSWFDPQQGVLTDEGEETFTGHGPWQTSLLAHGEGVAATGSQVSDVARFSISGEAAVSANTIEGENPSARAESALEIAFTVPVEAPFTFTVSFDFAQAPDLDPANYFGGYLISGLNPFDDCLGLVAVDIQDEGTWEFSCTGTAPAATRIDFWITLSTELFDWDDPAETHATVEFNLDFGDRDHDGLLDSWEEGGITVEGGGFIDLPGMGADPDRKDIFVELDVMEGVPYEPVAIDRVITAFADAPASLVDNYDGSQGIQLHVIVDGDRPEFQVLTSDFSANYHDIKAAYFGSEDERVHPNWPEIWDVRLQVFRYALWASTIEVPDLCGGKIFGIAEGIPSNDFMVAGTTILEYSSNSRLTWTAEDLTNTYAGTFMHELGHTLGLRHGGGDENTPNMKPNYLSIMNYVYAMPWPVQTAQGTNARDVFVLDFSHRALSDLDEFLLVESDGLDGPAGRKILFNSAPNDFPKARITLGWASAPAVNWNHDFDQMSQPIIDAGPLVPSIDINRFAFNRSEMCGGEVIPSSLGLLRSHSDWDRLQLGLTGVTQVADSALLPGAAPSEGGLDMDTILSILAADWVDQTVPGAGDLIFTDGFESGGE